MSEVERVTGEVVETSPQDHLAHVEAKARQLADALSAASDAGVSPALIMPRLMLVFREAFGAMPAGFKLPGFG